MCRIYCLRQTSVEKWCKSSLLMRECLSRFRYLYHKGVAALVSYPPGSNLLQSKPVNSRSEGKEEQSDARKFKSFNRSALTVMPQRYTTASAASSVDREGERRSMGALCGVRKGNLPRFLKTSGRPHRLLFHRNPHIVKGFNDDFLILLGLKTCLLAQSPMPAFDRGTFRTSSWTSCGSEIECYCLQDAKATVMWSPCRMLISRIDGGFHDRDAGTFEVILAKYS